MYSFIPTSDYMWEKSGGRFITKHINDCKWVHEDGLKDLILQKPPIRDSNALSKTDQVILKLSEVEHYDFKSYLIQSIHIISNDIARRTRGTANCVIEPVGANCEKLFRNFNMFTCKWETLTNHIMILYSGQTKPDNFIVQNKNKFYYTEKYMDWYDLILLEDLQKYVPILP